jgi:glycine/D-amino acid oxidase-like deaminating enzyme
VVIVGGGLVGAATAMELATAGLSVTLLEAEFPGAGSTGAAMGHLVVMDDSPAQMALCAWSLDRWRELLPRFDMDAGTDWCGTLWLAAEEAELEASRVKAKLYRQFGLGAELLDSHQLREAEPAVRQGLAGGLRIPGDGVCYPPSIARRMVEEAARLGAVVKSGSQVTEITSGMVRLKDGSTISTRYIVVAAGAHSFELIPGLPVMPRRGHLLITDRTPVRVHHQLVELGYLKSAHSMGGASVAFNVQPRPTGQLLVGSSRELVGFDHHINRPLLGRMLSRAVEFIPSLAAVAASLPLIGHGPAVPGVIIATGHEGLGITLTPATAALVLAAVTGDTPPVDPNPYRPDRPIEHHG